MPASTAHGRHRHGCAVRWLDRAHPLQGGLQGQRHRLGPEAAALHCASDSYKFDLTSDVTSQGDRISGNWSEASRNIFGNLQGTAGGGQIDVFVEANGFAANLTLRTTGNKQTVQISSKGEIRGVNITMMKG